MSKSFDRLIDGAIESLQSHVLAKVSDDFARGQIFSIIYALKQMKLAADWRIAPLLDQVRVQDAAFAAVRELGAGAGHPVIPDVPRIRNGVLEAEELERLRDLGDRQLAELLFWATGNDVQAADAARADEIAKILRQHMVDQLKVEADLTAKSMLQEIATGKQA